MAKVKKNKAVKAPTEPKPVKVVSAQLQKKVSKKKSQPPKEEKGLVFIKNLPHGFFEEQLTKYFRQFGEVTRLRLARSKKTGGSKGYAFVEFEFPEVAEYAADAMNNYLMFQKIVKAHCIPPEKQKYNYFKTKLRKVVNKAGKEIWISGDTIRVNKKVKQYNDNSDASYQKKTASAMKSLKKANEKFAALGIDVDISLKPKLVDAKAAKEETEDQEKILLINKKGKKKAEEAKTVPKKKGKIELKQLLEETLPEDDDDEDFVLEGDNASVSSNEKSYGISDSEEEEEEELIELRNKKKVKPTGKLESLIKKKPLAGGVQKYNKKSIKDTKKVTSAAKTALKKGAVAEIVAKGNVKKVKKSELAKKKGGGKKKASA
ncbi:NIFK family protein [Megaselia abdita]